MVVEILTNFYFNQYSSCCSFFSFLWRQITFLINNLYFTYQQFINILMVKTQMQCNGCRLRFSKKYFKNHKCKYQNEFEICPQSDNGHTLYSCRHCSWQGRKSRTIMHRCSLSIGKMKNDRQKSCLQSTVFSINLQQKQSMEKLKTQSVESNHLIEQLKPLADQNIIQQWKPSSLINQCNAKSQISKLVQQKQEFRVFEHISLIHFRSPEDGIEPNSFMKCQLLIYGLFLRLSGTNGLIQWIPRCKFISKSRFESNLYNFYPWMKNPHFSLACRKAIDEVAIVHDMDYEIISFLNLLCHFRDKVENIVWPKSILNSLFDKSLHERQNSRLKRKDPQTKLMRRAIAVFKHRCRKQFFRRPRKLTVAKYHHMEHYVQHKDTVFRTRQVFQRSSPFNHKNYYSRLRNQLMIKFSIERIADYLTADYFLLSSINYNRKFSYDGKWQIGINKELSNKDYNQIQSEMPVLTQWLPITKQFLLARKKLLPFIYKNCQHSFLDKIPYFDDQSILEQVVCFYKSRNLLRYETIEQINDSIINFDHNRQIIQEEIMAYEKSMYANSQRSPTAFGINLPSSIQEIEQVSNIQQKKPLKSELIIEETITRGKEINQLMDRSQLLLNHRVDQADYQFCSRCWVYKMREGVRCKRCKTLYHKDCWENISQCLVCTISRPSMINSTPRNELFLLYKQQNQPILLAPLQPSTQLDHFIFKKNEELLESYKLAYTFYNKVQQQFQLFVNYNSQIKRLHNTDFQIIKMFQRKYFIEPIWIENTLSGTIAKATRVIKQNQLISVISSSLISRANIQKYYKSQSKKYKYDYFEGPHSSAIYSIVQVDVSSFGFFIKFARQIERQNSYLKKVLTDEEPLILIIALNDIAQSEQILIQNHMFQ